VGGGVWVFFLCLAWGGLVFLFFAQGLLVLGFVVVVWCGAKNFLVLLGFCWGGFVGCYLRAFHAFYIWGLVS
ncbi:hypothetical protein AAGG49_22860, partial [Stenotrophomonas maltophilia]|uniref:hypothetical protein n=1 Tax=Stenotrophomonas maltophilia TaxID=40324 RepID=UPI00313A7A74